MLTHNEIQYINNKWLDMIMIALVVIFRMLLQTIWFNYIAGISHTMTLKAIKTTDWMVASNSETEV
jgi:hypothetical protein